MKTRPQQRRSSGDVFNAQRYKRLLVYSSPLNLAALVAIDSFCRSALIPALAKEGYGCAAAPRHIFMFPLFTRCWQELNRKVILPPLNPPFPPSRLIYLLISARPVRRLSNGGEENG